MTAHRDLKNRIRARQAKTGESYAAARAHVLRARASLLGEEAPQPPEPDSGERRFENAVVLKVNQQSARIRLPGESSAVTFRSRGVWQLVPGHVVTLVVAKRWTFNGYEHASGSVEDARIDVAALGLEPLPLRDDGLMDLRATYEPFRHPDPYAPLWEKLTAKPRRSFVFDPIAWGCLPGLSQDENPTCDAAELIEIGDEEGARQLLMDALAKDLRCLDAHAHLGNMEFEHLPHRANVHYEMGVRIGELSLPKGAGGVLRWGHIYNRPFLRCLHGHGLCLWRLGRTREAQDVFECMLALNPPDNQGVRGCLDELRAGASWEDMRDRDRAAFEERFARARPML